MELSITPSVVGVRFSKVGKIYHFSANNVTDVKVGDMVVVETSRGWQLGQVAQLIDAQNPPPEGWKSIDRRATPRDLLLRQMWQMKESEVVESCRTRSTDLRLSGIKIVSAEYSFDGSRLTILFSTETEEKYDLKSLRQDMQKMYAPSQVEMRQVGPRDVAKVVCGMGACGLETRCCCLFLTEFSSISIRMAKEQGISLTPTEITGMCGRLRCCLIYEYDTYVEARARLPKRNKRVRTPEGEGKVVDIVPLRNAVIVELPEVGNKEFPAEDVFLVDENAPVSPKPSPITQPAETDQAGPGEVKPEEQQVRSPLPSRPDTRTPQPAQEGDSGQPPAKPFHSRRPERGGRGPTQQRGNAPVDKGAPGPEKPAQDTKSQRPEQRWRKKPDVPTAPSGQLPGGEVPNQPKGPASGEPLPRNSRDIRRRKGRRRDSSEPQSGT